MKTKLFLFCFIYIELFGQINPNEFPKIGFADMYWLSKIRYTNYSVDHYFYPKLVELGLTHVVSYGDPIPLNPIHNTQIKILDNNFPRNAYWPYNNPFKYANAIGNYTNNFAYEVGGNEIALIDNKDHNFGMGSNGVNGLGATTCWWIEPFSQSYNYDKNHTDGQLKVYYAEVATHQPGIMMKAGFDPTHQPYDNKWDHIFYYKLFIKAKIDGVLGTDIVARVHIWSEPTTVVEINRNRLFEEDVNVTDPTFVNITYDITANQFNGNQYVTLPSNSFRILDQRPGSLQRVWVTIEWIGNRNLYIDNIAMCNTFYETLFVQNSSTARQSISNDLQGLFGSIKNHSLFVHPYNDEPFPLMYRGVGEVSNIAEQILGTGKYVNGATMGMPNDMLMLSNSQRRTPYVMYDYYPINANFDSVSFGENSIQNAFDNLVYWDATVGSGVVRKWGLSQAILSAQNYSSIIEDDITFYHTIQVQGETEIINTLGTVTFNPVFRVPTSNEIYAQSNLALCYGAKGIMYFLIMTDTPVPAINKTTHAYYGLFEEENNLGATIQNPANQQVTNYRFNAVKTLNQEIDKISSDLLQLTWKDGFSFHKDTERTRLYSTTFIKDLISAWPAPDGPIVPDPLDESFVEIGVFKKTIEFINDNLDYFMVMNRRCLSSENRIVKIKIHKDNSIFRNWKITDIATGSTWVIDNNNNSNSYFEFYLNPGCGKLFRLEPVMLAGGNIMYSEILPAGETWNLTPGVTFKFATGISLIVNGTLNAVGTSSNKITFDRSGITGTWGSITFDGPAASSSILNNVNIKYASDIKCLNGTNVTIQNSLIDHCTQGIYVYNSQPQILNNQIIEPVQNGIYCNALGKSPLILNNVITKTNSNPTFRNYQGIWLENHTNGYIAHNDISGFYWGIYVGGGSGGYFTNWSWQNFYPNNRIMNNSFGFAAGWGSSISAGYGMYYGMYNSIYNNVSYDVYCYQSSSITAQYNYWGGGLPKQYKDGTSYLNVLYPLTSDPWVESLAPNSHEIQNSEIYTSGSLVSPVNDDSTISDIYMAIDLEATGRIEEAINVYKNMIERNINTSIALTSLARIKTKFDRTDLFDYFLNLSNTNTTYKNTVLKILAGMFLQDNRYERALALYDEIIVSNENNYEGISARFEKFFAALIHKKDYKKASAFLSEISSLNLTEKELISRKEFAEYLFRSIADSINILNKNSNEMLSKSEIEFPKEYSLNQNYPNPFNPTTTIKYDLPIDGLVVLEVFDLLGRKIATLVSENKVAGSYQQLFDASSLASGVYVYKLQAGEFVSSKKMILLK